MRTRPDAVHSLLKSATPAATWSWLILLVPVVLVGTLWLPWARRFFDDEAISERSTFLGFLKRTSAHMVCGLFLVLNRTGPKTVVCDPMNIAAIGLLLNVRTAGK